MRHLPALVALAALPLAAAPARAERGSWRFHDDTRPIKAVVVGGSVTAWPKGNFGSFIEAACPRVEVALKGKERLGSAALRDRFVEQVVKNPYVKAKDHEALWLIFQSGLNSIASPEQTNYDAAAVYRVAHEHGLKVLALTVGPWGATSDKRRWAWANALAYKHYTQLAVDFVLGRLTPAEAFGKLAKGRDSADWLPAERPDIAVDLYDSPLRDKDAPLQDEATAARQVAIHKAVKAELKGLDEAARAARLAALTAQVREMPRWFMKKELHSFDHIHPNMEGHRLMAETICPRLPAAWRCDCKAMAGMSWNPKGGGLIPKVELGDAGAPAAPAATAPAK